MAHVKQIRNEPKCRTCRSDARDAVEAWMLRRALGEREAGERVSWGVVARAARVLIPEKTPSESALRRHWREHVELVSDSEELAQAEEATEAEADALSVFVEVMGDDWRERTPTPDEILELQRRLFVRQLAEDVKAGRIPKITFDQITRGIAESTKRKKNDAEEGLLAALTGGIERHFMGAIEGELAGEVETLDAEDAEFTALPPAADEPAAAGGERS